MRHRLRLRRRQRAQPERVVSHKSARFMPQVARTLTMSEARGVGLPRVLICDRDRKWSRDVRRQLRDAGIRVVLNARRMPTPTRSAVRHDGAERRLDVRADLKQPCCTRDEGRSLGIGLQDQVPNHRKLRGPKTRVVSVQEKAGRAGQV